MRAAQFVDDFQHERGAVPHTFGKRSRQREPEPAYQRRVGLDRLMQSQCIQPGGGVIGSRYLLIDQAWDGVRYVEHGLVRNVERPLGLMDHAIHIDP